MFRSRYLPCPECGASVERSTEALHRCEVDRWLDFKMFQLRHEVAGFEAAFRAFLHSPAGRFERWLALRGFGDR